MLLQTVNVVANQENEQPLIARLPLFEQLTLCRSFVLPGTVFEGAKQCAGAADQANRVKDIF
jgi:hypothetical protein